MYTLYCRLASGSSKPPPANPLAKQKVLAASGVSPGTTKPKQPQQQLQPITASSIRHQKQAFQPLSAVRAVARVAAAEAAVTAAAAALVPGKAAAGAKHVSKSNTKAPQHTQQRQHAQSQGMDDAAAATARSVQAMCLQVEGTQTGPRSLLSSLPGVLRRVSADAVAAPAQHSTHGSSILQASLTGGAWPSAHMPAQHSAPEQDMQVLEAQGFLQTLSLGGAGAGTHGGPSLSAAAQLAAYGLSKRIRAQLRSAHGPPAFQRSALPPRPASPPPVVLDGVQCLAARMATQAAIAAQAGGDFCVVYCKVVYAQQLGQRVSVATAGQCLFTAVFLLCPAGDMLMAYNLDAASPADVAMADLSSCNISCIPAGGLQPGSQHTDQQLSLQSFCNLVALHLSDNRLACFAGLAVLPSLQQLNLSANRLRGLQSLQQPMAAAQPSSSGHVEGGTCVGSSGARGSINLECQLKQEAGRDDCGAAHTLTAADSTHRCTQDIEAGVVDEEQQQERTEEAPVSHELGQPADEVQEVQEDGQHAGNSLEAEPDTQHAFSQQAGHCSSSYAGSELQQPCLQLCGFSCLQVLDLSYNMLAGEQLLGQASPLGLLPRQVQYTFCLPHFDTRLHKHK